MKPVTWILPGEAAAQEGLHSFLQPARFKKYATLRNDPVARATSGLSPWLHFGQLSAQRVAYETQQRVWDRELDGEAAKSFLEELVVRRELTDNYCHFNRDGYDKLEGLYPQYDNNSWAQKSLAIHAGDPREYVYTRAQFEAAVTHDPLWNAAQADLVLRGRMHGFLRMYWAKKILEWCPDPAEALQIAIWLNDKYQLDGRDPNGYVGCAWAIGGVHDQGWREREVFGKIRFMNYKGCCRKFDVKKYIAAQQVPPGGLPVASNPATGSTGGSKGKDKGTGKGQKGKGKGKGKTADVDTTAAPGTRGAAAGGGRTKPKSRSRAKLEKKGT